MSLTSVAGIGCEWQLQEPAYHIPSYGLQKGVLTETLRNVQLAQPVAKVAGGCHRMLEVVAPKQAQKVVVAKQ